MLGAALCRGSLCVTASEEQNVANKDVSLEADPSTIKPSDKNSPLADTLTVGL